MFHHVLENTGSTGRFTRLATNTSPIIAVLLFVWRQVGQPRIGERIGIRRREVLVLVSLLEVTKHPRTTPLLGPDPAAHPLLGNSFSAQTQVSLPRGQLRYPFCKHTWRLPQRPTCYESPITRPGRETRKFLLQILLLAFLLQFFQSFLLFLFSFPSVFHLFLSIFFSSLLFRKEQHHHLPLFNLHMFWKTKFKHIIKVIKKHALVIPCPEILEINKTGTHACVGECE